MSTTEIRSIGDLWTATHMDRDGVVLTTRGALMYSWILEPLPAESMDPDKVMEINRTIGRAIASLPPNTIIQVTAMEMPNVDAELRNYVTSGAGNTNPALRALQNSTATFFQELTKGHEAVTRERVRTKRMEILFTVVIYGEEQPAISSVVDDVLDSLHRTTEGKRPPVMRTHSQRRTERQLAAQLKELRSAKAALEDVFEANGFIWRQAEHQYFTRFMSTMCYPRHGAHRKVSYDPAVELPQAVITDRIDVVEDGRYLHSDGVYHGFLTLDIWPNVTWPGMMSLSSDRVSYGMAPMDFLGGGSISVLMRVPDPNEVQAWLKDKVKKAGQGGTVKGDDEEIFESVDRMQRWIRRENRKVLDVACTVRVVGDSIGAVEDAMDRLVSMMQQYDFKVFREDTDVQTIWAETLPGSYNGTVGDANLRSRRRIEEQAAHLLPIFGGGKGAKRGMILAHNSHYEPYFIDTFGHRRAFNLAAVGEMGSGKSAAIAHLALDQVRPEGNVAFIVDFGGSFKGTTSVLGPDGHNLALVAENPRPMSPFAGTHSEVAQSAVIWLKDQALSPGETLNPAVEALVGRAIREAFALRRRDGYGSFQQLSDLPKAYPGCFFERPRKRFYISVEGNKHLEPLYELMQADEEQRPVAELYFLIEVHAYKGRRISSVQDINEKERQNLLDRYAYLEEEVIGNRTTVLLFSKTEEAIHALQADGFDCRVDREHLVLEACRRQDLAKALGTGVRITVDEEWEDALCKRERTLLEERYGGDTDYIEAQVERFREEYDQSQYYEVVEGSVVLQDEVLLSNVVVEAKRIASVEGRQDLTDFIERLASFHGSGEYGDWFDRPGTIGIDRYKVVNINLKPVIQADPRLARAILGAVLRRITLYCEDVQRMAQEKLVILDEYQRFRELTPAVRNYVDILTRQSRKNNYAAIVGTQKSEDLIDDEIADQFQHYLIGSQSKASIRRFMDALGMTDEQAAIVSKAGVKPGCYASYAFFMPNEDVCDEVRIVQSSFKLWMFTTYGPERDKRFETMDRIADENRGKGITPNEAFVLACQQLAQEYPRGLR